MQVLQKMKLDDPERYVKLEQLCGRALVDMGCAQRSIYNSTTTFVILLMVTGC